MQEQEFRRLVALVQFVVGCNRHAALCEVRRRIGTGELDEYITAVRTTEPGAERCVRCLAPRHGRCDAKFFGKARAGQRRVVGACP